MKKLLCSLLTIAAIIGVTSTLHAQTAASAPPAAAISTNAPALTAAQVEQVNLFVDGLLPMIPAADIPLAGKIIGYLGIAAVFGRLLKGYIATGSVTGGLWHFIAGIFFNHTPQAPADTSQLSQGAAARRGMGNAIAALMIPLGLMFLASGCTAAINNGDIVSITERGFGIHITATSSTTQTPEIMAGMFSQTVQLLPTGTNVLHSPNFANSASVANALTPFSLAGDENTASGSYSTSLGTNIVQQPVVPSHPAGTSSN